MDGPPPPPPPHGENPHTTDGQYRKSTDLPPGNYDIFIVPPHSSGSGFLYLPSLQCHRNSFLAGAASTLFVVLLWTTLAPIFRTWYATTVTSGSGVGMILLALGVGVAGWAFGVSQSDSANGNNNGNSGGAGGRFGFGGTNTNQPGANYSKGSYSGGNGSGQQYGRKGPNRGNQYTGNQFGSGDQSNHGPNGAEWDRAREETRRKEELRRKMEEFKRKREAEAKEKEKQREREAMERDLKERREQLEREVAAAKETAEKQAREQMEKEAAEAKEKAAKEAAEKEAAAKVTAQKEAMARFTALKEAATKKMAEKKAQDARKDASPKKPPFPTARTATEEDDAYSFRPYDRPRRPNGDSSVYSESSCAPSQSTAHTTPPPSKRGTYSTKDPDKIVIQGVYVFNNAFVKTPVAQLVSGQGSVTDGLVLRITMEGLFIDDDVRGVGQREWDVKAWTMKLVEIWCPQMNGPSSVKSSNPFSFRRSGTAHAVPTSEESEAFLAGLLKVCKNTCRLASPSACFAHSATASGISEGGPVHPPQSSEFRGLHVLRATLRDQEGKRYVFVMQDVEAWKLAIGLQRLRGGSQVRALGVSGMPVPECKTVLGGLGYI